MFYYQTVIVYHAHLNADNSSERGSGVAEGGEIDGSKPCIRQNPRAGVILIIPDFQNLIDALVAYSFCSCAPNVQDKSSMACVCKYSCKDLKVENMNYIAHSIIQYMPMAYSVTDRPRNRSQAHYEYMFSAAWHRGESATHILVLSW